MLFVGTDDMTVMSQSVGKAIVIFGSPNTRRFAMDYHCTFDEMPPETLRR